MNFDSVRFKIPAIMLLFVLVVIFISFSSLLLFSRNAMIDDALQKNMIISHMMRSKLNLYIDAIKNDVEEAANFTYNGGSDKEIMEAVVDRLYKGYDYFDLVFFTKVDGRMIYSNPYNVLAIEYEKYGERDYFRYVKRFEKTYISNLYVGTVFNFPHFCIATPIYNDKGELMGMLAGCVPLSNISNIIVENIESFSGNVIVVDRNGAIIFDKDAGPIDEVLQVEEYEFMAEGETHSSKQLQDAKTPATGTIKKSGENIYSSVTFAESADWMISVNQYEKTILAQISQALSKSKIIIGVIILGAVLVGLKLSKAIITPVISLSESAKEMTKGTLDITTLRVNESKDEINLLKGAFKKMFITINEKVDQLEKSNERERNLQDYLNNILDNAGNGIIAIDEGKIAVFNKKIEAITGYSAEEIRNWDIAKIREFLKIDVNEIIDVLAANLKKGTTNTADIERVIVKKDGERIPCGITASRYTHVNGEEEYIFIIRDMSTIRQLEEELRREEKINIFAVFFASVVHDIGNPIAGIQNLIEIYKNKETTDQERQEIIGMIESEANDIGALVVSLLDFAKEKIPEKNSINIKVTMDESVNLLRTNIISNGIIIEKDYPEEDVFAYITRSEIKQVFINIIKNALEAIAAKNISDGKIKITLKNEGDFAEICVADNGVGMGEEGRERLFEPLFSTKKEGIGLGLASVYKIIRQNDGEIDVKTELGQGSIFYIKIPVGPRKNKEQI